MTILPERTFFFKAMYGYFGLSRLTHSSDFGFDAILLNQWDSPELMYFKFCCILYCSLAKRMPKFKNLCSVIPLSVILLYQQNGLTNLKPDEIYMVRNPIMYKLAVQNCLPSFTGPSRNGCQLEIYIDRQHSHDQRLLKHEKTYWHKYEAGGRKQGRHAKRVGVCPSQW